jgi:predicted acetyltransferase
LVKIELAGPGELHRATAPISHYFGRMPTEEGGRDFERILPPERAHLARENGEVVGSAGAYPLELTVPGPARVPAAGIVAVGVLPTHTRRGVLTKLMRAQLGAIHERGEPLAYLWASEDVIYGRFGYGIASFSGQIEISRDRAELAPFERRGSLRLLEPDEAFALLPPLYEQVAAETPGMFVRTPVWWEIRRLADPEHRRDGGGELARVLYELDGKPAGYALYRLHFNTDTGIPTGFVKVIEALGTSPAAVREIWRYLLDIDWVATLKAELLPLDHPLFFLLQEPRRLEFRIRDGTWLRLVDVGEALSRRGYAAEGEIVLDVRDEFCPWNEGRWRLAGGRAERTDTEPDIGLPVTALGSVYLGGFSFAELARAGRLEELREGALSRADVLFRTDRLPWCPEIF